MVVDHTLAFQRKKQLHCLKTSGYKFFMRALSALMSQGEAERMAISLMVWGRKWAENERKLTGDEKNELFKNIARLHSTAPSNSVDHFQECREDLRHLKNMARKSTHKKAHLLHFPWTKHTCTKKWNNEIYWNWWKYIGDIKTRVIVLLWLLFFFLFLFLVFLCYFIAGTA